GGLSASVSNSPSLSRRQPPPPSTFFPYTTLFRSAANVRDYVTLAAAAVDRNGKVSYVLIGYFWSTVDPRVRSDAMPSPELLVLRSEEHTSELQSLRHLVCRLLLEKKKPQRPVLST